MSRSEIVSAHHLTRKAVVYVRQSTPHQVLTNQESLKLQYALRERASDLGWRAEDIRIIDTDLGLTGASAEQRQGFKDLLADVSLGQVGIILSSEVTRLARNCSDWYPLLDLCSYKGCLIADREGVYDPATANGRLLLGLKGTLSELELHTIRARMTAGLLSKAERGELALTLPTGLVREETGIVHKDPNQDVQDRLALVFASFLRLRSASKVLQFFNAQQLLLPRRDRFGDIIWKLPTAATILAILKNPAFAGAFVYGRSCTRRDPAAPGKAHVTRLPLAQWRIRVNDVYPTYVDWATFERIQAMLKDNYAEYDRNQTRGVPRAGKALLQGVVACGECGHQMVVQYKGGTRYLCNFLRQKYRVPVCQYLPADPIDAAVVQAFFAALSPVELDAYAQAVQARQHERAEVARAHQQQVERLRYQAAWAQRQFNRVDPDNRLVAAELERRWEQALRALKEAEDAVAEGDRDDAATATPTLPEEIKAAFTAIGQHLPEIWDQELLAQPQKKALLRALIDKVVAHRVHRDHVQVRIVWKGGETTVLAVPVPVGSLTDLSGAVELEQQVVELFHCGKTDVEIAAELTSRGHRSPLRRVVLPSTVRTIRLRHRLFQQRHQSHPRQVAGYLTVSQLAAAMEVPPHWLYDRIHTGRIPIQRDANHKLYLFPDTEATRTMIRELLDKELQDPRHAEEYPHV
jgi:DNA invertase Pin-like site-specific DNA recombinase